MARTKDKNEGRMQVSDIKPMSQQKPKQPPRRGSSYQPLIEKLKKLKPGHFFSVEVPKGVQSRTMHNRINAALRRNPVDPPKGCRFEKTTNAEGNIDIACVKD